MTLQQESTLPIPTGMQPDLVRALTLVLRELDQVLVPELESGRAKSTANMIGNVLRHLIVRETGLPALLDGWTATQQTLLEEAGVLAPASADTSYDRNHAVTSLVASLAAEHAGGVKLDDWCRRAVAAECLYLAAQTKAQNELPYPQNTPERTALCDVTPERMTAYLAARLPHKNTLQVTNIHKLLGGLSKETFIIDVEADGAPMPVVMRRDIALSSVAGSVMDEVPVLRALHGKGLAVPELLLAESDRGFFGEAFTITRKAPGVAASSNLQGLTMSGDQKNAARALAAFLGDLHGVDAAALGLQKPFFDPALSMADCVLKQIEFYETAWLNRSHRPSPTMSAAFAWLRANVPPSSGPARIIHGDAGLHNMMLNDGKISVMLDWELAHMGDPVEELAYCRTWVDQAIPWEEFLEIYYSHGGLTYRPEHQRFYTVLSNLRVAVYAVQSAYGTYWSEHPELPLMYASNYFYAVFIDIVSKQLTGDA
jgi:aminoglycoside phosphotransferase (APT) family kinase protein